MTQWLATAEEKVVLVRFGNGQSSRVNLQSSLNALDRVVKERCSLINVKY